MKTDNPTGYTRITSPASFLQAKKASAFNASFAVAKKETPAEETPTDTVLISGSASSETSTPAKPQHSAASAALDPGDKIKHYYDKIEPSTRDKKTEDILSDKNSFVKDLEKDAPIGALMGCGVEYASATTGATTLLHEHAHGFMVNHLYEKPFVDIQVDGIDNLKNLISQPSVENLGRLLSGYDANQDGGAGMTRFTFGEGLNETGQTLGANTSRALVSAAGSISEEIPSLMGFAAGFKLRKKHPVMGYTLMTAAGIQHLSASSYTISAVTPSIAKLPGHDWAKFAELTGIPPLATAIAFTATMPLLGAAMWFGEKRAEEKVKDRLAVGNLVRRGDITPRELARAFTKYGNKEKLKKAEDSLMELLNTPRNETDKKQIDKKLKKAVENVRREYGSFGDFLAKSNRAKVDEEKKHLSGPGKSTMSNFTSNLKDSVKESWKADKVGAALTTGTLAGAGIVVGKSLAKLAFAMTGSPAALSTISTLSSLLPGVSLVGTAAATYRAGKALNNPNAGKMDKTAAVSTAVFSGLCTAGMMIPGAGAPLVIAGVAGILGTYAVKALVNKMGS